MSSSRKKQKSRKNSDEWVRIPNWVFWIIGGTITFLAGLLIASYIFLEEVVIIY